MAQRAVLSRTRFIVTSWEGFPMARVAVIIPDFASFVSGTRKGAAAYKREQEYDRRVTDSRKHSSSDTIRYNGTTRGEKGSKTHERNTLPFDVIPYPNKYLSFPRSSDRRSFECEGSRIWDTV